MTFVAADIYYPSMLQVAIEFSVRPTEIQWTVSSYFLGLALCQVTYVGYLHRFGFYRLFWVAMGLFLIASFGCSAAQSIWMLVLYRFLQGFGIGSGIILGRHLLERSLPAGHAMYWFPIIIAIDLI